MKKYNYIYIDCKIEDEIREFCSKTVNAEKIIEYVSLFKGKKITGKTLLIFDEVQECPNIVSAYKNSAGNPQKGGGGQWQVPFPGR